jgi:hypothetical protein
MMPSVDALHARRNAAFHVIEVSEMCNRIHRFVAILNNPNGVRASKFSSRDCGMAGAVDLHSTTEEDR